MGKKKLFWCILFMFCFLSCSIPLYCAAADGETFVKSEVPEPVFSVSSGFYEEETLLALSAPEGCKIYYTVDGTLPAPGKTGTRFYSNPIRLRDVRTGSKSVMQGTVIRAVAVQDGNSSDCVTHTYFIGRGAANTYRVPVVSLVTDPENLYDPSSGIFVNYWESGREWERPFYMEYFDADNKCVLSVNCGGRVHGGASRSADTKSIRLYARKEYDAQKSFSYDFFSNGIVPAKNSSGETIEKFKRLLLRGGGNEATSWDRTYFRDSLTAWIMKDTGLDVQASQPAVVFLNGSYYGILNLRERQDERYVEEHYGLDETKVAVYNFYYDMEGKCVVYAEADTDELAWQATEHYKEAYEFATTADLMMDSNYQKVCEYYDIENYIDYLCIEIYCNNTDWPGNNCKAWSYFGEPDSSSGSDGKIRWFLYDTEFGYGLYGNGAWNNSLSAALADDKLEWPNPKGSTLLFRSLLANDTFRRQFVTRMLDLLNENFQPDSLIKEVGVMASRYAGLIRENRDAGNYYDSYDNNIAIVKDFLRKRPDYMYEFLDKQFDLGARYQLCIQFDSSMGSIQINSICADADTVSVGAEGFQGIYYNNYPVAVTAAAKDGYHFTGFKGSMTSSADSIVINNENGFEIFALEACFEADADPAGSTVPENNTFSGDSKTEDNIPPASGDTVPSGTNASQQTSENQTGGAASLILGIILAALLLLLFILVFISYQKKRK